MVRHKSSWHWWVFVFVILWCRVCNFLFASDKEEKYERLLFLESAGLRRQSIRNVSSTWDAFVDRTLLAWQDHRPIPRTGRYRHPPWAGHAVKNEAQFFPKTILQSNKGTKNVWRIGKSTLRTLLALGSWLWKDTDCNASILQKSTAFDSQKNEFLRIWTHEGWRAIDLRDLLALSYVYIRVGILRHLRPRLKFESVFFDFLTRYTFLSPLV